MIKIYTILTKYFNRLKRKWDVQSNLQFWIIMLVFAITGTSILIVKPFLFELLGINSSLNTFLYVLLYILIITPVYFINLTIIGTLLGQYRFVNAFVIKRFTRKK